MAIPAHSHISQAYPKLDFETLPFLVAAVLNRKELQPSCSHRSLLHKSEMVPYLWPYENDN